jgi:uncharacterized SAM-binding protein YcdF (DUF218 family)
MWTRDRRALRGRAPLLFAAVVVAAIWAGAKAGTSLVVTGRAVTPEAIVMLASHEWERLPEAARLARENASAVVVLTEPRELSPFNCHLCAQRTDWLANLGVDRQRVVVLPQKARNTYEEAVSVRAYCEAHAVRRLVIVTSPYHTRRALAVFTAVLTGTGTTVGVVPALSASSARPGWWWWLPDDRAYVAYEWAALAWYAIRHQVSPFIAS